MGGRKVLLQKLSRPRFLICDPRSYGDLGPNRPCREPNVGFFRIFDFAPCCVLKKQPKKAKNDVFQTSGILKNRKWPRMGRRLIFGCKTPWCTGKQHVWHFPEKSGIVRNFWKKCRFFNPDLRVEGGRLAEDMDRGKCLFFHVESESGVKKNRIFWPEFRGSENPPPRPRGLKSLIPSLSCLENGGVPAAHDCWFLRENFLLDLSLSFILV